MLSLLISNVVTRLFFWTPHQQLFNILTPLLCVYFAARIASGQMPYRALCLAALAAGLLLLVYGNLLLVLPVLLAGVVVPEGSEARSSSVLPRVARVLLLVVVFVAPLLVWIGIVRLFGVTFYNHELVFYRQFIWLLDGVRMPLSAFAFKLASNSYHYAQTMGVLGMSRRLLKFSGGSVDGGYYATFFSALTSPS